MSRPLDKDRTVVADADHKTEEGSAMHASLPVFPGTALEETPLTSGDLARACHTTTRTVRFYEEAELVEPVTRSEGGHRLYAPRQVARLALIIDLREAGLSLQEIKDLFELKRHAQTSAEASERMTRALHARIEAMQEKIACLSKLTEELRRTASIVDTCRTCPTGNFPEKCSDCGVMTRPDLPRAMRLLWG